MIGAHKEFGCQELKSHCPLVWLPFGVVQMPLDHGVASLKGGQQVIGVRWLRLRPALRKVVDESMKIHDATVLLGRDHAGLGLYPKGS